MRNIYSVSAFRYLRHLNCLAVSSEKLVACLIVFLYKSCKISVLVKKCDGFQMDLCVFMCPCICESLPLGRCWNSITSHYDSKINLPVSLPRICTYCNCGQKELATKLTVKNVS